jgi:hypothetical protein
MIIRIDPNGQLQMLYCEAFDFKTIGEPIIRRASHVEPGDGGWWVDLAISGGPVLGPFALRSEAIQAEIAWLEENRL